MGKNARRIGSIVDEFISIHGGRYSYENYDPEAVYTKDSRIWVICPDHGRRYQLVRNHFRHGCRNCAIEELHLSKLYSREECIRKSSAVHGDRYDYSSTEYRGIKHPITIRCRKHGSFLQMPQVHWRGGNCPNCRASAKSAKLTKTTEQFIDECVERHGNRYDYRQTHYTGSQNAVMVICPVHGPFDQNANYHVRGGNCPSCRDRRQVSDLEQLWLDEIGIPAKRRQRKFLFPDNTFVYPDGIDYENKTVYLFMGDYWHGNPEVYDLSSKNPTTGCSFGELYEKTQKSIEKYRAHGYEVIVQWEKDFVASRFYQVDTLNIDAIRKVIPDETAAYRLLETIIWGEGSVKCPHCGNNKATPDKHRPGLYVCTKSTSCHKQFNVRYNLDPFYRSQIPLHKWLYAIYMVLSARRWVTQKSLSSRIQIGRGAAKSIQEAIFAEPGFPIIQTIKRRLFREVHLSEWNTSPSSPHLEPESRPPLPIFSCS